MMSRAARRVIVDDPAAEAAERIAAVVRAGGHVALAGGNTPSASYERLAGMNLDWSACTLWFGDERCVPPDDERSNYGMAREALLDRIERDPPDVRRIPGEEGADAAAGAYERELVTVFGDGPPALDLVLLGIGHDGHTASLFPGQPSLDERERSVVGVEEAGQEPYVPRVTLTLPAINAAREVFFLVVGEGKADPVARAFGAEPSREVPSSLVAPDPGTLTLLLDAAAASKLG